MLMMDKLNEYPIKEKVIACINQEIPKRMIIGY
jgi:hypothetical protein